VFHGSPVRSANYSLLCIGSPRRYEPQLEAVLQRYESRVVRDPAVGFRQAQLAAFDVYLAYGTSEPERILTAWNKIRRFDENTPFVIVGTPAVAAELAGQLRPDYEHVFTEGYDAMQLVDALDRLLLLAGERGLEARKFAVAHVTEEISERLAHIEQKIYLSRQSFARVQEHVMRAQAMRQFHRYGGTRAFFDRLWPDIFEEALQRSYPGA
jgi:hypothetical protein